MKEFKKLKIGFSVHYGKSLPEMDFYKKKYKIPTKQFVYSKRYAEKSSFFTSVSKVNKQ